MENKKPQIGIESSKIKFCRNCGSDLLKNSEFCRKCGTKINEPDQNQNQGDNI